MRTRIGRLALGVALASVLLWPTGLAAQRDSRGALAQLNRLSESFEAFSARVSPAVVQILAMGYALLMDETELGSGLLSWR